MNLSLDVEEDQGGPLKAPFPYFGGKSRIAEAVWERFGNTLDYIEPFAGSAAMLLARPDTHEWWNRGETINDLDGFVSNYWRATKYDPDAVAQYADWIVSEIDQNARHAWLVERKSDLQARLEGDPDYYDAKSAGYWLYGICMWIGVGWCSGKGPWRVVDGKLVKDGRGQGINKQLPFIGNAGRGILTLIDCNEGNSMSERSSERIRSVMCRLANRLRRVRVACGDWSRVCSPAATERGLTAVFLDPPYSQSERTKKIYSNEMKCADEVSKWAIENGENKKMRIALCGYDGEHSMPESWSMFRWKTQGGYANRENGMGKENSTREVVWFSPNCLSPKQPGLF